MPAYTTITNGLVAVGAKPFATTIQALRDNPLAIAEKDVSVPNEYRLGLWLLGAGVIASGTQIDFTGIPARARRVTVLLSGVSHNAGGGVSVGVQIGDSGGVETTGYTGSVRDQNGPTIATFSSSFLVTPVIGDASQIIHGRVALECVDPATNLWVAVAQAANNTSTIMSMSSGSKALSATLDRVRIILSSGSFDAGTVNVSWE